MATPKIKIGKHSSKIVSRRRIALTCTSGIVVCLLLTGALRWLLHDQPGHPLAYALANGISLAALLAAVLFPLLRRVSREADSTAEALHKACGISSSAICICRVEDGSLLQINYAFTALTGYTEDDVRSKKLKDRDLWQDPAKHREVAALISEYGAVRDMEMSLAANSGARKDCLFTGSLIEMDGEPCIIAIIYDVTALKSAQDTIETLSNYDPDTGLPNQNLLMDRLNQLISLNNRNEKPTAVIYVGMDGFRGIVDALGHTGSIAVINILAERLTGTLRHSDTVARLNRDELVIVLGGEFREADIDLVLAKIGQVFLPPIQVETGEITVTASLGVACSPLDGLTGDTLLQHSHAAMNRARADKSGFRYYSSSMNVKAMERLQIESGMMRGLEQGEFFLCYQPKYATCGTELTGMEALVRWRRDGEVVPPDQFIPVAEETGLIAKLGEWVLKEACLQNCSWLREGFSPLQVSVNISPRQLRDNDFVHKVERILAETGLDPELLELEITESAIMSISDDLVLKLLRLKGLGVSISIDDFGTGYSSLSYLKHLPVDKIKIDRSFVMDIVSDPDDAAIVNAIISMAHALDLGVIAEGVESKGQLDFLAANKCTEFQGFYFAKPLTAEQFEYLLKAREASKSALKDGGKEVTGAQRTAKGAPPAPPFYLVPPKPQAESRADLMQDVLQPVEPVAPQDRILKVLGLFQRDMELKVLPVVEEGAIVGIVNRATFLEEHIIGRHGFGAHINHAKKIRDLMEPVEFTFDGSMRITEAAAVLQPAIGTLRIDHICVTSKGAYAGMLDVNRFFKAMTEIQIVLAKGANPLTGLPGNTSIEREICQRLDSGIPFDVAYFDIDHFKPFNDYYGFHKGDEIIKKLAELMSATAATSSWANSTFCGHIGGDDFILITESLGAEPMALQIAAAFEGERLAFHGQKDFAARGYTALNRKGEEESFALLSLSVGIVNTSISQIGSYAKLASLSSEVKKAAKKMSGTSVFL